MGHSEQFSNSRFKINPAEHSQVQLFAIDDPGTPINFDPVDGAFEQSVQEVAFCDENFPMGHAEHNAPA